MHVTFKDSRSYISVYLSLKQKCTIYLYFRQRYVGTFACILFFLNNNIHKVCRNGNLLPVGCNSTRSIHNAQLFYCDFVLNDVAYALMCVKN